MSGISVLSGNVLLENVPETDVPDKKMWIQSVDGLDQGSQLNADALRAMSSLSAAERILSGIAAIKIVL